MEYDDDDYSQAVTESNTVNDSADEFREYSIDLWNGAPYIPHWETDDENVQPNQ